MSEQHSPGMDASVTHAVQTTDAQWGNGTPKSVLIFRPTLGEGGADRVSIILLRHLNRELLRPSLALVKKHGVWLEDVPDDVPIMDLGVNRLRFSWLRLASVLREARPDILLSTSSGGNLIAALAHSLAPDPNRSLVLSERNTFSRVRRERRSRWLPVVTTTSHLYRRANRIIAVSKGVAADLIESLDLPEGLVTAIHNPIVDDELFQMAEEPAPHPWLHEGNDIPTLLAVGRLVRQKDYPTLLRAFRDIRKNRRVRLIILGEGEMRRELQRIARDIGIQDDVDLPGFVKNPFPFMRRCTVYVLSSRFEGLPGALIQAMACGAPSVATDCPSGPSEIIDPGKTGFLVPVGDRGQLVQAIEKLLDDTDLRRRFSQAARDSSTKSFGVDSMMRSYEQVLLDSCPSASTP